MEVFSQQVPGGVGGGFEGGDVDKDGVVDLEVADIGGLNAFNMGVAEVGVADGRGGLRRVPQQAGPCHDGQAEEAYQEPEPLFVEGVFHEC